MPTHPLILITGGRGRLASAAREALAAAGMDTRSFSRTAGEGHLALEDLLHPGVCEDAHALIHSAWSTVPLVSERDPGCEWHNDFPWLIRLLRHLAEQQTKRPPHFIFFSSGGTVYGDAPPDQSSCEDSPLRPKGWHGFAKVQAEQLVREACTCFNLPCTILRIANPYGMLATNIRPQGIIPILIRCALNGEEFHLWGDGSAEKDFLHIKDFNSALVTVLTNKITGTFNLCYGRSFSVNTLIHEVERLTSRKIKVVHGPSPLWDVTASRLDNRAFCKAANWTPRIDFAEGLMDCIQTISQDQSQLQN